MKIALPVTTHDQARFKLRNDLLLQFGGLLDHSALIIHSPGAKKVAQEEYDRLSSLFGHIDIVQTTTDLNNVKAVVNQNVMFYATVMNLARLRNSEPWIYLEADAAPTQKDWANRLQNAYRASGQPYFGNLVEMPVIRNGVLEENTGETMMMGVGIYPPNMTDLDNNIRALVIDLGKQGNNPGVPFDVYLRGEQRMAGWANTDLIADQWNTQSYRAVDGGFQCIPAPIDRLVRNRGGFVSSKALVIHGCKDNSLYELLKGNKLEPVKAGSPVVEVKTPAVTTIDPAPNSELPTAPKEVWVDELSQEELDLKAQVEARLARGSLRLNVLADETGRTKDELSEILKKMGFFVQKPSLWVKKA